MSSRRGRNRNSSAVSDRREDDSKGSPEKSDSSLPEIPLSYQYETEDGLMIEISPTSATASREYQLSENDYLEFDAGIEWDLIDIDIGRDGRGTDISGSVGLPGDILGVGGGVEIDLSTGEITGGDISLEAATVGLDIEVSRGGCEVSVGLSVLGFGATYTRDECEDEEEKDPSDDKDKDSEGLPPGRSVWIVFAGHKYRKRISINPSVWSDWSARPGFPPQTPTETVVDAYGNARLNSTDVWAFVTTRSSTQLYVKEKEGTFTNIEEWVGIQFFDDPGEVSERIAFFTEGYGVSQFSFQGAIVYCRYIGPRGPKKKDDIDKKEPPGKPPMRQNECCTASTKMIREIHKALDVRELLDNQLIVPNRLVAPNAKGSAKLKSYLEISQWLMRMSDHLGIHPFKASLTDANAAQAGNQKVEIQFASGTAGLRQVVELLLENKGDAAARLNLQIRSAVAIAQVLKVATITSKTASAIANFIGMPLKEKISKIKMPFDISLGKRRQLKGFDPSKQKEAAIEAIGMNEEASTEEILPEFLQTGEQPYVHETYDGNFPNLIEQLKGQGRNG